jgi:hypothetical protein
LSVPARVKAKSDRPAAGQGWSRRSSQRFAATAAVDLREIHEMSTDLGLCSTCPRLGLDAAPLAAPLCRAYRKSNRKGAITKGAERARSDAFKGIQPVEALVLLVRSWLLFCHGASGLTPGDVDPSTKYQLLPRRLRVTPPTGRRTAEVQPEYTNGRELLFRPRTRRSTYRHPGRMDPQSPAGGVGRVGRAGQVGPAARAGRTGRGPVGRAGRTGQVGPAGRAGRAGWPGRLTVRHSHYWRPVIPQCPERWRPELPQCPELDQAPRALFRRVGGASRTWWRGRNARR